MRIAFTTLGCKINQYESDQLRQTVAAEGNTIVPFDSEADVYIINTCSVTAKSDYQCRQIIRSAARRGKNSRIVVTGCYASTRPEELKNINGVDFLVPNDEKMRIPSLIRLQIPPSGPDRSPLSPIKAPGPRTRGFLKIQDGCNNRCSYCIVPLARGNSRSVDQNSVVSEFARLMEKGFPEIVLTGVHIGTYGLGLSDGSSLTTLLHRLTAQFKGTRIRLSSIEPQEITPEIIGFLGNGLCRHLHIPLQSGDDSILSAMKRHYTAEFYLDLVTGVSSRVPGVALGADVMVGFPGEGEREFENTYAFVEKSPLTHLHVFSYSRRPGTAAAEMKGQVPESVKKERSELLRQLGLRKNLQFRQKLVGSTLKVVVEDKQDRKSGLLTGLTDNYIRVLLKGAENRHIGRNVDVLLDKVENLTNFGIVI